MTVGSPPSITATTLFVVPRSMPMILAICVVSPVVVRVSCRVGWVDLVELLCLVRGRPGVAVLWRRCLALRRRGDGDEGRPDDAVAEPVAASDLLDDLAVLAAGARHRRDRLVLAGVERPTRRGVDLADALALEQRPQLAVDRGHALDPRVVGDRRRPGLDRPVEVVGQRED